MIFFISTTNGTPPPEIIPQAKKCPSPVPNFVGRPITVYYIAIDDLSSLLSLIKDYPIVIDRVDYDGFISDFEIEIYNGYRE